MWFKQARLFQLAEAFRETPATLNEKLEGLAFQACLPSMPYGAGWVSPLEEDDAPLAHTLNGHTMICLQIEEKLLPPIVIRQELTKKIKEIETLQNRKVSPKEKYALKDDITTLLLPRAFSKLSRVYAYFDTHHRLILGTANDKKADQFLSAFKKTFGDGIEALQIKKLSTTMTTWLQHQTHSSAFSIEKACVLQDANQQSRVIRCKEQDLFSNSIQAFLKEGCEVKQLALNWQDRANFILSDDLSLQRIQFKDELIEQGQEIEMATMLQQFNADFLIMTETFQGLFTSLLESFIPSNKSTDNIIAMAKMA